MSTTETSERTVPACPSCGGGIEPMQTICAVCRVALEEQVMAVHAADYPVLFQSAPRGSAEHRTHPMDPTSLDMLKVAENAGDDFDLVPLVPMDEPRRQGNMAGSGTTAPAAVSSASPLVLPLSSSSSPASTAPITRPPQTLYSEPAASRLAPTSRWKHIVVAVACLAVAVVLAAVLWSKLVPRESVSDAPKSPEAQAKPAPSVQPRAAAEPKEVDEPRAVAELVTADEPRAAAEPKPADERLAAAEPVTADEPRAAAEPKAVVEPRATTQPKTAAASGAVTQPKVTAAPRTTAARRAPLPRSWGPPPYLRLPPSYQPPSNGRPGAKPTTRPSGSRSR